MDSMQGKVNLSKEWQDFDCILFKTLFLDWMCRPNLFRIGCVNHNSVHELVFRPGQQSYMKYISFFVC